ncbi:MAG: nitrogen fixation protein NifX [Dactylosporangium sp.]|nr:nitrogen fixation protein NifX [Dactylosporangium sp.]NNJ61975.1 nitrogen fixation protein NifX [Dactylosporangium sp.]
MLRVAFATSDGTVVDQHFAECDWFAVYDLDEDESVLVASRTPATAEAGDSRIDARLAILSDCAILHVASIGGPAAARVVNARIHPIKVPSGTPIEDLIGRLRVVLAGTPPPWLRKAIRQSVAAPAQPAGPETVVTGGTR